MIIKSYQQFVESKHTGSDYKYGCVLIYLDISNWNEIISLIDPLDLYEPENPSYGLETDPHVTILYGLHDSVPDSDIQEVVNGIDSSKLNLKINGIGVFENKEFDVVKFNVESDYLHQVNSMFRKLPHTSDYPDYKPHITIAYVEPGTGSKYIDGSFSLPVGRVESLVYSKTNDEKVVFKLF